MTGPYRERQEVPKIEEKARVFCSGCKFFEEDTDADDYPNTHWHKCQHPVLQLKGSSPIKEWIEPPKCIDINGHNSCVHFDEPAPEPEPNETRHPWYKRLFFLEIRNADARTD